MSETLSLADAEALMCAAFQGAGVSLQAAQSTAHALVSAEADGQAGHGFSRLADYLAQIRSGKVKAQAQIRLSVPRPACVLVDADCGLAYPALDLAIQEGVPRAKQYGLALMGVTNSHHCGSLALHVEKLAQQGLIGLMFANTPKAIAPWGGKSALFGTNPIAFAAPRDGQPPLVIDLSLSQVARGKIMNASKTGASIPEGWALDQDGQPTTDPKAALQGTMLPIGGAKGTSLALMVEILAAALTGAAFSSQASSFFEAEGPAPRVGQCLLAIDAASMSPDFAARLTLLLDMIEAEEGARLPGARRLASRAEAQRRGLSVPKVYLDAARAAAAQAV